MNMMANESTSYEYDVHSFIHKWPQYAHNSIFMFGFSMYYITNIYIFMITTLQKEKKNVSQENNEKYK